MVGGESAACGGAADFGVGQVDMGIMCVCLANIVFNDLFLCYLFFPFRALDGILCFVLALSFSCKCFDVVYFSFSCGIGCVKFVW